MLSEASPSKVVVNTEASPSKVVVNTEASRTKPYLTFIHAVRGLTARIARSKSYK